MAVIRFYASSRAMYIETYDKIKKQALTCFGYGFEGVLVKMGICCKENVTMARMRQGREFEGTWYRIWDV